MLPQDILSLLQCQKCNFPNLLDRPTTTPRGATLCMSHVQEDPETYMDVYAHSGQSTPPPSSNIAAPTVDATVNKVIQLTSMWLEEHGIAVSTVPLESGDSQRQIYSFHSNNEEEKSQGGTTSLLFPQADSDALIQYEVDLAADLTCHICCTLLYKPVTTPCQHTFCTECLLRTLDENITCPICLRDLPGFSYFQDHPLNTLVNSILLKAFPDQYQNKATAAAGAENNQGLDTPIFVCKLGFPGIPVLLHIFEPRHKLMLDRCLEDPHPAFGMIMPPAQTTEFGTMLEIKSVSMLPDGRSMVETTGLHRFRILERGTQDGFEDVPPSIEELIYHPGYYDMSISELMAKCTAFLSRLQQGSISWAVERLMDQCGPQPADLGQFSFWIAMILPISEREKTKLLAIRSAKMRLALVVHWVEQLEANGQFSNCLMM